MAAVSIGKYGTKLITEMSPREIQEFLDSFDVVLSDCDGVLWMIENLIEGSIPALKKLQDLGKRVYLVSNNSQVSFAKYKEKVRRGGLDLKPEQLIVTSKVIAWYLNKIDFRGEAYVIASKAFRQTLQDNGIKMIPEDLPIMYEDDVKKSVENVLYSAKVKAVIVDFSFQFGWTKMAHVITTLRDENVLYLIGPRDEWLVVGANEKVLGPGPLIDIITRLTGRTPTECAKPSNILRDCVKELTGIKDPKRCLFIGDSIYTDMGFATKCGFQKLFVGSGLDKIEDAVLDKETRPDYYAPRLGCLLTMMESLPDDTEKRKSS